MSNPHTYTAGVDRAETAAYHAWEFNYNRKVDGEAYAMQHLDAQLSQKVLFVGDQNLDREAFKTEILRLAGVFHR